MTKVVVEFKVIEDVDNYGGIQYYVHADKKLIAIRCNLRQSIKSIALYIKGLEKKQKLGLPKVIYTDTYSYDKG